MRCGVALYWRPADRTCQDLPSMLPSRNPTWSVNKNTSARIQHDRIHRRAKHFCSIYFVREQALRRGAMLGKATIAALLHRALAAPFDWVDAPCAAATATPAQLAGPDAPILDRVKLAVVSSIRSGLSRAWSCLQPIASSSLVLLPLILTCMRARWARGTPRPTSRGGMLFDELFDADCFIAALRAHSIVAHASVPISTASHGLSKPPSSKTLFNTYTRYVDARAQGVKHPRIRWRMWCSRRCARLVRCWPWLEPLHSG